MKRKEKQVEARLKMPDGQRWYNLRAIQTIMQMTGRAVRSDTDVCDCVSPETKILTATLEWKNAADLKVGEKLLSFDEQSGTRALPRRWRSGSVLATGIAELPRFKITLASGKILVSTPNHRWISRSARWDEEKWVRTDKLRIGQSLNCYVNIWDELDTRDIGWLAGFFDGEGCLIQRRGKRNPNVTGIIASQNPGPVLDKADIIAKRLGFKTKILDQKKCHQLAINGGFPEHLRFLGQVRPIRLFEKFLESTRNERFKALNFDPVVSVEFIGNGPMVTLQSSTETYIAGGFAAHNTYILDRKFDLLLRLTRHFLPKWWLAAIKRETV